MTENRQAPACFRNDINSHFLDECLRQMAEKDMNALNDFYHHTKDSVYAYALSVLKNPYDAQDVLHDCYLSVYANADQYHSNGKPLAWVFTIVKNLCLMKLRKQSRISDISEQEWEGFIQTKTEMRTEDKLLLKECLFQLNDEERQIVTLHAVAGFKHWEIARQLDLPLATVLSKYHRSMKKLKEYIKRGEKL